MSHQIQHASGLGDVLASRHASGHGLRQDRDTRVELANAILARSPLRPVRGYEPHQPLYPRADSRDSLDQAHPRRPRHDQRVPENGLTSTGKAQLRASVRVLARHNLTATVTPGPSPGETPGIADERICHYPQGNCIGAVPAASRMSLIRAVVFVQGQSFRMPVAPARAAMGRAGAVRRMLAG